MISMISRMNQHRLFVAVLALFLVGCSAAGNEQKADRVSEGQVRLAPDPAFAGARIAVVFADASVPADQCRFEWRRNGLLISDATSDGLDPNHFSKGDKIEVSVVLPPDGGGKTLTASTKVANTAPTIGRVTLAMTTTSGQAEFLATPESFDRDGDVLTHKYRWYKNGILMPSETSARLPISTIERGEQIAVKVVASDGEEESESPPVQSEDFAVENHPPHFTSQPAMPGAADSVYRYRPAASDEDQDVLRYELVSGPAGMSVGPDGEIVWVMPPKAQRAGDYAIKLRVLDNKGGESRQEYTIRFTPPARIAER